MIEKKPLSRREADLRKRAEEIARERTAHLSELQKPFSMEKVQQTLHELRVCQIELELQNEELRRAQAELESTRARYFELYDLAPVGYVTLSEQGLILEANITAATLLGVAKGALVKQPLTRFILPEDQDIYYLHHKQLFEPGMPQVCELRMVKKDGTEFWARFEATVVQDGENGNTVCHAVMSDITKSKRAEEELHREKYFAESLIKTAQTIVLVLDTSGRIVTLNPYMEELSGYQLNEVQGKDWFSMFLPESDRKHIRKLFLRAISDIKTCGNVNIILTKDGREIYVQWYDKTLKDEKGNVVGVLSIGQDITQKKRAEVRDCLAQEVLDLLNRPVGSTDTVRNILHLIKNRTGFESVAIRLREGDDFPYYETNGFFEDFIQAERYLCARDEEGALIRDERGTPVLECMCGNILCGRTNPALPFFTRGGSFWSNCTTDLLSSTTEEDRQARTRNRCNGYGYESVALIPLRRDDEVVGLLQLNDRRRNQFTLEMIHFFEGLGASIGIALSRKWAEKVLTESKERYRMLFENAGDAIFIHDDKAQMLSVNTMAHEQLGYTHDELMSMKINQVDSPAEGQKAPERIALLMEKGYLKFETVHQRKDGTLIPTEVSARKIIWHGQPAMMSICRDFTERKVLQERLMRAEKMEALGLLAGGVAHDLNNALGILVGYSELLYDGLDEYDSLREDARNIMMGGERAAAIVQDLLTLARRGVQTRTVVNLNKTVTEYLKSPEYLKLTSYHPTVRIKAELDEELLKVAGSAIHLSKTLMNLVSNAVESMPSGGDVVIKTESRYLDRPISGYDKIEEGDYIVLIVSDTGEGITDDDMKRIFEPFYTKKVMGRSGTGLGLSVVWGTVKDHNGYIDVQSRRGKGTTFILYFPVTHEEMEEDKVTLSDEYMGCGEKILVVDDINVQRDLASRILSNLNYLVETVASGEEAVEYLKKKEADLIVLDMIMDPGIDGFETYRQISELRPETKAIIVSGFAETDRVKMAQSLGAGAFVKKPYIKERIGLAVRKELDRK